MRNIIMAFILGSVFANSVLSGADALTSGDRWWFLELIVFPVIALAGLGALLLEYRKRASTDDRRPNSMS